MIVDTNIIISAILKDSTTRMLLFKIENVYYPEPFLEEIQNHKKEISIKSSLSDEEIGIILAMIFKNITLVPKDNENSLLGAIHGLKAVVLLFHRLIASCQELLVLEHAQKSQISDISELKTAQLLSQKLEISDDTQKCNHF